MASAGLLAAISWFALSVFLEVVGSLVLYVWLVRRGERPSWVSYGRPGYLEGLYRDCCERTGVSPRRVLALRRVVFVSLLLSALVFAVTVAAEDRR